EDLGGFYLDILKDRLYTTGVDSIARRSAQTALWHIAHALLRIMAPILSVTAEEAWAVCAGEKVFAESEETIFTQTLWQFPAIPDGEALLGKYAVLRGVRADVTKQLEEVRASGAIGSSLQAELALKAYGVRYQELASLGDDLKFVFITSDAKVEEVADAGQELVTVSPSNFDKCER